MSVGYVQEKVGKSTNGKSTYHDNNNNNNTFNRPVHHSVMIDRVRAVPQAHDL